jgi:hypothetical protein
LASSSQLGALPQHLPVPESLSCETSGEGNCIGNIISLAMYLSCAKTNRAAYKCGIHSGRMLVCLLEYSQLTLDSARERGEGDGEVVEGLSFREELCGREL